MWKSGSTPKTTSSAVCDRPGWAWHCSRLASRLPWVSIAAFGEPAVPLVKISTARSSAARSTTGAGVGGQEVVERDGAGDVVAACWR